MSRIDEIVNNTEWSDVEKCRKGLEFLNASGTSDEYDEFVDALMEALTRGTFTYPDFHYVKQNVHYRYLQLAQQNDLCRNVNFSEAFVALLDNDKNAVFQSLQESLENWLSTHNTKTECNDLMIMLVQVFKNAFSGFWSWVSDRLLKYDSCKSGISELCASLEHFYYSKDVNKTIESLLPIVAMYPHLSLIDELLGYYYFQMGLWKNSIAYYERAMSDENHYLMEFVDVIRFKLGYAYSKTKNYLQAAENYVESLKVFPAGIDTKNNLGLCYLHANKFADALRIFEECINENRDTPYCYNNKVRTLIAIGKVEEALAFAQANVGRGKVSNSIIQQAQNAIKRKSSRQLPDTTPDEAGIPKRVSDNLAVPKQQFSNERLLEEELVARIDRGIETFGLHLRIYERAGDFYGRQFPISGGRIDILAVDEKNNLYAIELKKDSGYGDVCEQVEGYISWLRQNKAKGSQKVFGIVCMNNPSEDTISRIKRNSDIRLFEYSIGYREI